MTNAPPLGWEFDHVGMVVPSLQKGRRLHGGPLGIERWSREWDDPVNGVRLQFGIDCSGIVWELLEPLGDDSPVANALKQRTHLLNHLAYRVEHLDEESAKLRERGALPIAAPSPAIAFGDARIQFFMTGSGLLLELIEAPGFTHHYESAV